MKTTKILKSFKALLPLKGQILCNAELVDSSANYSNLEVLELNTNYTKGQKITREDRIFLEGVRPIGISATSHLHNCDWFDLQYGVNQHRSELTYKSNYIRNYFAKKRVPIWFLDGKKQSSISFKEVAEQKAINRDLIAIKAVNMIEKACLSFN